MRKEINLILDFDSTIIELETIEVLAEIAYQSGIVKKLKKNVQKFQIQNQENMFMESRMKNGSKNIKNNF